jgi:hypothetical protein
VVGGRLGGQQSTKQNEDNGYRTGRRFAFFDPVGQLTYPRLLYHPLGEFSTLWRLTPKLIQPKMKFFGFGVGR